MPVEHSRSQAKAAGPSPTALQGQPEQLLLNEQFEAIFKHSFDGIWICDGQGKVLRVNPASEKMNQIKAEEIAGQNIALLEKRGIVDRSVTLEAIEKRAPVTLMQKNLKTGRRCLVTATPIFDEKGDLVLVVSNDRDLTELDNLRRKLLESEARSQRFEHELKKRELDEWDGMEIVCHSEQLRQVLDAARNAASFDTTVLITGESGTGKGLLAKFVHMLSPRREGPFVRVDCGSLPESLLESELFG
ncbi:MAG: sigma 54-interacting transcriptional regulator, partial [Desulfarculaceae bacterium]